MADRDRPVTLKSESQIERMARAGRLVADVLDAVGASIVPGVTTLELDGLAEHIIRAAGGVPSFIGVPGHVAPYRHSLCISLDSEVVHGVPGKRRIVEGQIVSVDAGAIIDGWHGDAARSWTVGQVSPAVAQLVDATRRAMLAGIAAARPGNHIGDISAAVEDVALAAGYGVVRSFVGHGIGTEMHEEPQVPNYGEPGTGPVLKPGMVIAIEPMVNAGAADISMGDDNWSVYSADGSLTAHFEFTVAITENGPRVLTPWHELS